MALKELEDYHWFPQWMRNHQMEFLAFMTLTFKLYQPIEAFFKLILHKQRHRQWTDACSGTGAPALYLRDQMNWPYPLILTDLYPMQHGITQQGQTFFLQNSVDILQQLPPGDGLISLFNSFHHFNHQQQKAILHRVATTNRIFFVAEILQPTLWSGFLVLFSTTIGQLMFAPFIRPFSVWRLVFTYLIPVHIFTTLIDGLISVIKSPNAKYFSQLASNCSTPHYSFQFTKYKGKFAPVYVLYGMPVSLCTS